MDNYVYSEENLREQIKTGKEELGYIHVRFFVDGGLEERLATTKTKEIVEFYFLPSDQTLRDRFNVIRKHVS
jgi:hypothetical protein